MSKKKKDKTGGSTWVPTNYGKLVLTSMEMFDLVDIQRVRHPNLRKFSYESKALKMKSRIDFFLVAKSLTKSVKKTEIYPSIAPDHNAIYIFLPWTSEPQEDRRAFGQHSFQRRTIRC